MSTDPQDPEIPVVSVDSDGNAVLHDPVALAVIRTIAKNQCSGTFVVNSERIAHFKQRVYDRDESPDDVVIVILNVDDSHGGLLAQALMPGFDWQAIRDRGETPFARGLAQREGIQAALADFDEQAAEKLRKHKKGVAVVVVDHDVAEIYRV